MSTQLDRKTSEFPRASLLWPPLLPIGVATVYGLGRVVGHFWNVHGDFIYLVIAFATCLLVAIAFQGIAVFEGAQVLRAHSAQRNSANVACMAFACLSIAVCAWLLVSFVR